ncbi:MAG TPA: hypothetical protein VEW25_11650 [Allosphingosinicella sp.]|nr:hypothetical protein [Allosphingosinicella sp.]
MKNFCAVAALVALPALSLAGCATASGPEPSAASATLRLGETARIGGLAVRALRVEEDSRCPSNVQCIQAGTVRLAVALGAARAGGRETVLRLDEPVEVEPRRWLRLAAVCPYPRAPGPTAPSAYRFLLAAATGGPPPPPDFACPP